MELRVVIEQDEDGVFIAECPESLRKHGDPIPPSIDEEVVEIGM